MIALAVVWVGYQLVWYGYSMVRGPGMGFTDLMLPTRVAKADSVIGTWGQSSKPKFDTPQGGSYVDAVGVQAGSIYNPPLPGGGLQPKPTLGKTPPAGYGN